MTDIVERLRRVTGPKEVTALACEVADEIDRLRAECEEWKDRYEAERQAHMATIKHADEKRPAR